MTEVWSHYKEPTKRDRTANPTYNLYCEGKHNTNDWISKERETSHERETKLKNLYLRNS